MQGTARGTMQGSWRPRTASFASSIRESDTLSCSRAMEGVGLTAVRKISGMPLVMPPRMPPAWFVRVRTVFPSM